MTPELCMLFHYLPSAELHFLLRARALVVFPGGYGILGELFRVLTLLSRRAKSPRCRSSWSGRSRWSRQALDVDFLVDEGVIDPR